MFLIKYIECCVKYVIDSNEFNNNIQKRIMLNLFSVYAFEKLNLPISKNALVIPQNKHSLFKYVRETQVGEISSIFFSSIQKTEKTVSSAKSEKINQTIFRANFLSLISI